MRRQIWGELHTSFRLEYLNQLYLHRFGKTFSSNKLYGFSQWTELSTLFRLTVKDKFDINVNLQLQNI